MVERLVKRIKKKNQPKRRGREGEREREIIPNREGGRLSSG